MKLLLIFTTIACFQAAAHGYAQTLNLSFKNSKLEKVFTAIEQQSGFRFVYTREQLETARPVSIEVRNGSIQDVLEVCFREQPLTYTLQEPYIIVKKKESIVRIEAEKPLTKIGGKVTNEDGEGIAGATVAIKGSHIATATDEHGNWKLEFDGNYTTLVVSCVGYTSREIAIGKKGFIEISLELAINNLDEMMVIAYGKTTRRLNTGNVSKVSAAEIERQPVSNPLATLQGRVPGLEVSSSSGIPGSSFAIQIRGRNSIAQGTQPLFIIDGVPFAPGNGFINQLPSAIGNPQTSPANANGLSPFAFINPADIESIEVLKDADATSIYGSRGANGVIIITTKRGKTGRPIVSASFYTGYSKITRMVDFLNTQQYVAMRREAFANDNVNPTTTNAPDILVWDTSRYTDFKRLLIGKTAHSIDGQASFSAGTDQLQYFFGSGYHRETTVFPGDMYAERGSVHLNVKHRSSNKRFTTDVSLSYISGSNHLSISDLTSFINMPPNTPFLFDPSGNLNWQEGGVVFTNPLSYLLTDYVAKTDNLVCHFQTGIELAPGLVTRLSGGYNSTVTREERITPIAAQNPANNPIGESWYGNRFMKSWIIEPQIEYRKKVGFGKVTILTGGSFQKTENEGNTIIAAGYTSDALIRSISAATIVIADNSYKQYKYAAVFLRVHYNLNDKYILNLTGRRDGSSRFGPANRFANFGSIGGAWIFSDEKIVKNNLKFLSFGKLRANYGTTGNDQITDYQYLDTWSATSSTYQGVTGLTPTRLFNPGHQWEVNRKLETAIELGFFKEKIIVSASFFRNRSSNQLIDYRLPMQTGFSSVTKNFEAHVQNKGWEFFISTANIAGKKFNWSSYANLTIARNKLLSFPGIESSSYANSFAVGKSLNVIKKYKLLGVDPATGIYQFEDVNNDGVFNSANDFQLLGNLDARFYGGLGNTLSYKGWKVDLFFEFKKQTGRNYLRNIAGSNMPGRNVNQPVIVLNRWQNHGDLSDIQKFSTGSGAANTAASRLASSNGIFSDASFIRAKNIAISYSLPEKLLSKTGFDASKIFLNIQNAFTITNYMGADPETQNIYVLPPLRTIAAGIQITF